MESTTQEEWCELTDADTLPAMCISIIKEANTTECTLLKRHRGRRLWKKRLMRNTCKSDLEDACRIKIIVQE